MIVVEERLRDLFLALPSVGYGSVDYNPIFSFGNEDYLFRFLETKKNKRTYPLIWLETPITSSGYKRVDAPITLILATNSSASLSNSDRLEKTIKPLLAPLVDNCIEGLHKSGFTTLDESSVRTSNYYNYGVDNDGNTYGVWDAIKLTCNVTITDCKQREFNF